MRKLLMFEELSVSEQRTCSAKHSASEILYRNIIAMQKKTVNLSQFEFGKFSARLLSSNVSFGLTKFLRCRNCRQSILCFDENSPVSKRVSSNIE